MSDYKWNALCVQSNQFVRKSYNSLKANEIKMFDIFVSCIDTMHPKTTIEITKSELLKAMGDNGENYATTRDTLDSIFHKGFLFVDEKKTTAYHFINKFEWYHDQDIIKVEFHKDIISMLIDLKTNFLTYSPTDLNQLKSRYSMILYKYILSYIRQYKCLDFTIDYTEIKKVLNVNKKYTRFDNFRNRILKPFVEEVNHSSCLPYLVSYSKIMHNRKVSAIQFTVRARTTRQETLFTDIQNNLIYEERTNALIKGNTPIEDIKNRQADAILSKPLEQQIEEAKQLQQQEDNFPF